MRENLEDQNSEAKAMDRLRVALISYDFGEYCVRLASALAQYADILLAMPDRLAVNVGKRRGRSRRLAGGPCR